MAFACPLCNSSTFSSQEAVQHHILLFHSQKQSSDINYECNTCGNRFFTLKSLNQHKKRSCQSTPVAVNLERASTSTSSSLLGMLGEFGGTEPSIDGDDSFENLNSGPDLDPDPGSDEDINEDEEDAERIEDILQQKVAAFLLHIKDECNATQTIINEIIKGMDDVIEIYLEWVKDRVIKKFEQTEVLSRQDTEKELDLMRGLSIFQGSQNLVDYLEKTGRFVKPRKLVFKTVNLPRSDGSVQMKDEEFAYNVPFVEQLTNILSCKDVLECVQNPKPSPAGTYRSLLDGSVYKNHPVTLKHKNPLCFVLHTDGAELTDLGSARVGKHSITNISWILANIDPELRSTDRSINLLSTVKSKWLNHKRMGLMLEDFKEAMIKLASDEGLKLTINGEEMIFHGFLYIVCGDHPAQGFIGGFKETVSSDKPCRRCLAARAIYLKETDLSTFVLRTEEVHSIHVKAVEAYVPSSKRPKRKAGEESHDPSVRYGVNRRSHLMDIPHFPVTSGLVQDIMHLGPEGILGHACRLILVHVVGLKEKPLALETINDRIKEFSKNLRVDRPNYKITEKHLAEGLRQSAAQMRKLTILLPFVLRKKEGHGYAFAGERPYLDLLVLMLKIMNLTMAFELQDSDVDKLKKLLSDLHQLMLTIDPKINMGKIHFMHHLPEQITLYGVLRQQACFRFEAHFAFFKRLTKLTKNFVNILLTLSVRHQTRQCHYIMQPSFLYTGHKYGKLQEVPLTVREPDIDLLKAAMSINHLKKIEECSSVKIHSATFSKNSVILMNSSQPQPKFAKILKIYVLDKKIGFICQTIRTLGLNKELHAYEVVLNTGTSKAYIDVEKLKFKQEILSIKIENKWLLIPNNHRALLT